MTLNVAAVSSLRASLPQEALKRPRLGVSERDDEKNLPYSSSLPRLRRLAYSTIKTNNDAGAVYGTVDTRSVRLAFEESGDIATLNVQEGQTVPEGDVMGTLDDTRYRIALSSAEGAQEVAKKNLTLSLAGARLLKALPLPRPALPPLSCRSSFSSLLHPRKETRECDKRSSDRSDLLAGFRLSR